MSLVSLSIPTGVLLAQGKTMLEKPFVVVHGSRSPSGAWVLRMGRLVWSRAVMGCAEHLSGFKYHLDDMLVTQIVCGFDRIAVYYEDVHGSSISRKIILSRATQEQDDKFLLKRSLLLFRHIDR